MLSINSMSIVGLRIGSNINRSSRSLFGSMEKLCSGLKINRASDNPAALVISEQLRSQIASLGQEIENINANMNNYSTADSMVGVMRDQLVDMRAMAQLDEVQIEIGAKQKNKFESLRASKMVSRENLIAAESSLRDTDFVSELTNMIKSSMQLKMGLALLSHSRINARTVLKIFA